MSFTTDLIAGLAEWLDAAGAGTWNPDDTSSIVDGALPDEVEQGIGLTPYNLSADSTVSDVVQPVQLYLRGDAAWVKETADLVFDEWHGQVERTIGGIRCALIELNSDVPMGVDQRGRTERALNYQIHAHRPTASRPD